jgi:peptidoglycan-associated lipoprotein
LRVLALAALPLAIAACSSTPLTPPAADAGTAATGAANGADGNARGVARVDVPDAGATAAALPPKRSIYFEYDRFTIRNEDRTVVNANAEYAARARAPKVVVEGNADERGSREYNLALGQKRAEAVRQALAAQGVADDRLEAVSFGAEKPANAGHDESAWAENRRADIQYR